MNILIAEDNEYTVKQYKASLQKRGHLVTVTKDGVDCVEEYVNEAKYQELFRKEKEPPFDVVLLDHDMPRKNGTDAAKEILAVKPTQRIIFLSAFGHAILDSVGDDLSDDTIQILQKPFSLEFLISKVEGKLLRHRVIGEQVDKLMTSTQDVAAIR